ncbi:hypothetical protein H2198_010519 [Neophaeococcomyces mojaviensis]|uniref:Uncharacterized protein n=1 Tax=Neophaeococcomyces mojaviensis TaxID=3383035 RepID=A0ACC2ZRG9_9EURO|nr:hypothetical protein H2198_010519 [Knufia sp. JES_112]
MYEAGILIDTPKKTSLRTQSTELRTALKEFERTFTEDHGRKPKQTDIKNDLTIAAKYKKYQRVQDVLAGKIAYEKLLEASPQKSSKKRYSRVDSGLGSSPQKRKGLQATPRKNSRDTAFSPTSPKVSLLNAIGPTPHRDGKVLGLFDLLQNSVSKEDSVTPSLSTRKRKIEELYSDTPARRSPLTVIQTPSQRSSRKQGDILEFLSGTPQKAFEGPSYEKHSRTPQSDGKKFVLSQLFVTPSTQRFLFPTEESRTTKKTPLRSSALELTPQREPDKTGLDATPTYLRRSTSFKDRLLSVTAPSGAANDLSMVPASKRVGPPTLRHFRSSAANIFKTTNIPEPVRGPADERNDHDDDLEALREMEGQTTRGNLLVEDSQFGVPAGGLSDDNGQVLPVTIKPYKKKGQKRTTKKTNIRPVTQKKATEPKFVAADDSDEDAKESDADEIVDETQLMDSDGGSDFAVSDIEAGSSQKKKKMTMMSKSGERKTTSSDAKGREKASKRQPGTINPNAQSHMNYRSLKIKNKSSRAKGAGRSKFGRGRR